MSNDKCQMSNEKCQMSNLNSQNWKVKCQMSKGRSRQICADPDRS